MSPIKKLMLKGLTVTPDMVRDLLGLVIKGMNVRYATVPLRKGRKDFLKF